MQMRELNDRWILPIAGHSITRCCIDHDDAIELSVSGDPGASIRISGSFDIHTGDGRVWSLHPSDDARALAPALILIGLTVNRANAYKNGTLDMIFSDGSRVYVAPDADFEAWEFSGEQGTKAVSLPGGEVAIWSAAA
jgi:hypothetical protein